MNDRLRSLLPWLLLALLLFGGSGGKSSGQLDVLIIEDIQARATLPIEQLAILTSESDASVISWLTLRLSTPRSTADCRPLLQQSSPNCGRVVQPGKTTALELVLSLCA